ncbi:hypothetical protein [Bergeyella sp. RCAD1439]|uniref:hypothetical protein n=1 Tax=Bergeyella anatis TaxID=3113737 RepID=UPI002E177949|nr:hypothetical protein [Bergeyella sp. RCAD1439]
MKKIRFIFLFVVLISACGLLDSCDRETLTETKKSSEKEIVSVSVKNASAKVDNTKFTVDVEIPANVTNLNLETTIKVSPMATLDVDETSIVNYETVKAFVVTAEDGTQRSYAVNVLRREGFRLVKLKAEYNYEALIDEENKTLTFYINKDKTKQFNIVPTLVVEVSDGASYRISSGSGSVDVENPPSVVLIKSDKTEVEYQVRVKNFNNVVQLFSVPYNNKGYTNLYPHAVSAYFASPSIKAGLTDRDFIVRMLETENLSAKIPRIVLPINATISPAPDTPQDFNQDVAYKITSEAGTENAFKVRVIKEKLIISGESIDDRSSIEGLHNGRGFFYYIAVSKIKTMKFVGVDRSYEFTTEFSDYKSNFSEENYVTFSVNSTVPAGKYRLVATLEDGSVVETYYRLSVK